MNETYWSVGLEAGWIRSLGMFGMKAGQPGYMTACVEGYRKAFTVSTKWNRVERMVIELALGEREARLASLIMATIQ